MPYKQGSTPRVLHGKGIPQKYMDAFISVFNSVYKKEKDHKAAFRNAHAVMAKELHKDGYRKGRDGKWTKAYESYEEYTEVDVGGIIVYEEIDLDKAFREGLKFEGVAFIDDSVSQLGTGWERYYSADFNNRAVDNTNKYMELGHVVTMYNSHGSAGISMFAPQTKNPIGKIDGPLSRVGNEVRYAGFISPTQEGKEVIQLIHDGVMGESSVRMAEVRSVIHQVESAEEDEDYGYIEEMVSARLAGIDLCDQAGITGAGIVRVLEQGLSFEDGEDFTVDTGSITISFDNDGETQEDTMELDWKELTLDELIEKRKDLLDEYAAVQLEASTETLGTQTEEFDALKVAHENLKVEIAELTETLPEQVQKLELELAIEQAAQVSVGKEIAEALREVVKTLDDIPEALATVRGRAMVKYMASRKSFPNPVETSTKGFAQTQGNEEDGEKKYTAAQLEIMRVS